MFKAVELEFETRITLELTDSLELSFIQIKTSGHRIAVNTLS